MNKLLGFILVFFLFYFTTFSTYAFDSGKAVGVLNLPDSAKTEDVVPLGKIKDTKTGRDITGFAFIRRGPVKNKKSAPGAISKPQPSSTMTNSVPNAASTVNPCYGYTLGAHWKNLGTPWVINPQNSRGLNSQYLLSTQSADIAKWEEAADGVVGDGNSINILGNGTLTNATLPGVFNGQNEVFFGQPTIPGAVAVTTVWGYFDGRLSDRSIVEWDQIYNDIDYDWSATGAANKYDFEAMSTHELGHVMGLWDQYDPACSEATMHGYADRGETKKRTLDVPDIAGIKELYEAESTDNDTDGYTNLVERYIGTDPNVRCGANAWAPDIDNDGAVSILDITLMSQAFGGLIGDIKYNKRYDLDADGGVSILDLTRASNVFTKKCTDLFPA